mmetsp:Transcript_5725/g.10971  ORF Transcript_5725/g.10971 Transcript_5725/m.10971 type:complete len:262 (+) Transcript_5725:218-1003(+)
MFERTFRAVCSQALVWALMLPTFLSHAQEKERLTQGLGKKDGPALASVRMYTFGAPRVGNTAFAEYFDSLGVEAFRVVNGADIVPRLPRHRSSAGAVLDYEHVGKTVLIEEEGHSVEKGFWVEGESPDDKCPLRDVSPLNNPFSSDSVMGQASERAQIAIEKIQSEIGAGGNIFDSETMMEMLGKVVEEVQQASDDIRGSLNISTPEEALSLMGVDAEFVQSELKLIDSLRSGTAIEHHLEPSYFAAVRSAIDDWEREAAD